MFFITLIRGVGRPCPYCEIAVRKEIRLNRFIVFTLHDREVKMLKKQVVDSMLQLGLTSLLFRSLWIQFDWIVDCFSSFWRFELRYTNDNFQRGNTLQHSMLKTQKITGKSWSLKMDFLMQVPVCHLLCMLLSFFNRKRNVNIALGSWKLSCFSYYCLGVPITRVQLSMFFFH